MHPDLVPVYGGMGTCYRWSPWLQGQGEMDNDTAAAEIEYAMKTAMKTDDTNGGKGEWVGLLGFSQGANISISVLFENELRKEESKEKGTIFYPFAGGDWKFGVILAGRGPPKCLGELTKGNKYFQGAGDVAHEHLDTLDSPYRLKAPTVHLHGLRDPGLEQHRELYRDYCTTNNAVLLEWDEAHRVPFRPIDVKRVVEETLKIAKVRKHSCLLRLS